MTGEAEKAQPGNFIAEWFGHRVYPVVAATPQSLADQQAGRCPFLSDVTETATLCIKPTKSRGVCTISSIGGTERKDWLVCPFRALDPTLIDNAARRLFGHPSHTDVNLVPASTLADEDQAEEFRDSVRAGIPTVVYFQNKLGGEISLNATSRSPEFSFDATMVEVIATATGSLQIGRYGIFEIQTMDFHGTYSAAVENLTAALHLHRDDFAPSVAAHSRWLSEKVEGPNIANVFKRTFYQMMFKFQLGTHGVAAGCVFAIPRSVWDSWQRHLGKPELVEFGDGTYRLATTDPHDMVSPPAWIYVFDVDISTEVAPNRIRLTHVIGTDANALGHYALDVAPAAALEEGASSDRLLDSIRTRLATYLPEFRPDRPPRTRAPRQSRSRRPTGLA